MQGLASTGEVASISTGWGPLALAGLLAAASPCRPQVDQLVAGLIAAAVITVEKTFEGLSSTLPYGLVYFVVMGIAPIVIITLGQAAYTGYAVRSLLSWQRGFGLTQATVTSLSNVGAAHTIGQGFLTEFGASVQPLFARILSDGRVTEADGRVAASAAEQIRQRLTAVVQETWLERLDVSVEDTAQLANQVDQSARAALTALLTGLPRLGVTDILVNLRQGADKTTVEIVVSGTHDQPRFALRPLLAPNLRVLYVVFHRVRIVTGPTEMTLKFIYRGE
jgi:hypothetical protein